MSREVCGVCWTPYDDGYKCACPMPALDIMNCPRCGKVTDSDTIHTCTPKALLLAQALNDREDVYDDAAAELRRLCKLQDEARMLQEQNTELDRKLADLSERRLTDEIIAELWYKNGTYHHHFARAIERWLKGQD